MEMGKQKEISNALRGKPVIIYGAHLVAVELYRYIKSLDIKFDFLGFAVTEMDGNPIEIEGERVEKILSYRENIDAVIMIAMPEKYHDEVEAYVRELGFSLSVKIGLADMSELKGRQLLGTWKEYGELAFELYEDAYDKSWLNMADAAVGQKRETVFGDLGRRHYKFPTLYHLSTEAMFREAGKFDFYGDYKRIFGSYYNLHSLTSGCVPKNALQCSYRQGKELLNVYMVFSKWDSAKAIQRKFPSWIYPIQAGSILTDEKTGTCLDEMGDNISVQNGILAEMTAAYWIWKNAGPVEYKGLCHYRRHFVLDEKEVTALDESGIDVILTTPRYAPGGIRRMFLAETPVKEPVYQSMARAVAECHLEDKEAFEVYMDECLYFPNNMVIARSRIYDAYCEWIFPVLFRMQELDVENDYGHTGDRHIAYAAELLTSYFFAKCKDKYRLALTDYILY